MSKKSDWLIEREVIIDDRKITYSYDRDGDVLEIIFQKGGGVGIDLADNIVLRYDQDLVTPLSLIFTSYSRLIQPTPFGPPSYHLAALSALPSDMQENVLRMLNDFPVNHFLRVSGLRLSPGGKLQPITYLAQLAALSPGQVAGS